MPQFSAQVAHVLGTEQATQRLVRFIDQVRRQYGDQVSDVQGDWNENVLNFSITTYGFTIGGTLTVGDNEVAVDGRLPLAALPFRGKIEQSIATELRRELS